MQKEKSMIMRIFLLSIIISTTFIPLEVRANNQQSIVSGTVYEFGSKDHYEFANSSEGKKSSDNNTYGNLKIIGSVKTMGNENGACIYDASGSDTVSLAYTYDDELLKAEENEWHIIEDKSKTINDLKLEENILKGAVVLQISRDQSNWITVDSRVNAFANPSVQKDSFYDTTDIQLMNGCYYRVIVAYELAKKGKPSKILFVNKDNYEYKKIVEVYNFYICDNERKNSADLENTVKTKLGKKEKTEDEGYTGVKDIDKDDPHYGWELGDFFVLGYTSKNTIDGKQIFLKNVGDEVTLGFNLKMYIDCLNGNKNYSIAQDEKGYDKYFETSPTDFGRGTLFVRYTDPNDVQHEYQMYTNYLEANLSPTADTVVHLCEEGDYEVALDYKIQNDNKVVFGKSILPEYTYYRIFFEFSVRNSNCMVYTFDNKTGSELFNGNMTQNGFYIDFANSQYLDVSVKKEVLEEGAEGLTEDTRFNRKAKDKEAYAEDGIYTITVKNKAADLESSKKIYVGDNKVLKAYMVTGLSISEIQSKIAEGATISEDGKIIEVTSKKIEEETVKDTEATEIKDEKESESTPEVEKVKNNSISIDYRIILVAILTIVLGGIVLNKKKHRKVKKDVNEEDGNA